MSPWGAKTKAICETDRNSTRRILEGQKTPRKLRYITLWYRFLRADKNLESEISEVYYDKT